MRHHMLSCTVLSSTHTLPCCAVQYVQARVNQTRKLERDLAAMHQALDSFQLPGTFPAAGEGSKSHLVLSQEGGVGQANGVTQGSATGSQQLEEGGTGLQSMRKALGLLDTTSKSSEKVRNGPSQAAPGSGAAWATIELQRLGVGDGKDTSETQPLLQPTATPVPAVGAQHGKHAHSLSAGAADRAGAKRVDKAAALPLGHVSSPFEAFAAQSQADTELSRADILGTSTQTVVGADGSAGQPQQSELPTNHLSLHTVHENGQELQQHGKEQSFGTQQASGGRVRFAPDVTTSDAAPGSTANTCDAPPHTLQSILHHGETKVPTLVRAGSHHYAAQFLQTQVRCLLQSAVIIQLLHVLGLLAVVLCLRPPDVA